MIMPMFFFLVLLLVMSFFIYHFSTREFHSLLRQGILFGRIGMEEQRINICVKER